MQWDTMKCSIDNCSQQNVCMGLIVIFSGLFVFAGRQEKERAYCVISLQFVSMTCGLHGAFLNDQRVFALFLTGFGKGSIAHCSCPLHQ